MGVRVPCHFCIMGHCTLSNVLHIHIRRTLGEAATGTMGVVMAEGSDDHNNGARLPDTQQVLTAGAFRRICCKLLIRAPTLAQRSCLQICVVHATSVGSPCQTARRPSSATWISAWGSASSPPNPSCSALPMSQGALCPWAGTMWSFLTWCSWRRRTMAHGLQQHDGCRLAQ